MTDDVLLAEEREMVSNGISEGRWWARTIDRLVDEVARLTAELDDVRRGHRLVCDQCQSLDVEAARLRSERDEARAALQRLADLAREVS